MAILQKTIQLDVVGLGIIFYSPQSVREIPPGANFLRSNYMQVEDVQSFIQKGTLVRFGTGSPGTYILKLQDGYPSRDVIEGANANLRLGLCCTDGVVCFRDLYDLISWDPDCPADQTVELDNGLYDVTLSTKLPASGIRGDHQVIEMYFQQRGSLPDLATGWIPTLA